ncbi:AAA family ATPase [Terriglobus roseus]|uniref:Predicted ATP-binding protein involved in virulence n=1 Tax=Terriglobus roseus TaxID=392734 RepID=A0A1G7R5J3_9BACT|nr:AAA family ATPase [Terriglobus roseus]SDG06071.1 Predicted ATP-binding protein involved in virulence [Terriglobus roseus]
MNERSSTIGAQEPDEPTTTGLTPRAITRIAVTELFGYLNYDLHTEASDHEFSKLFILYGENGSGKTRLLQAVYHLLSPAMNRGHRKRLAELPFLRLSVAISGGCSIVVSRAKAETGDYSVYCDCPDIDAPFEVSYLVKDGEFGSDEEERRFKAFLRKLNIQIYLLSAERSFASDVLPNEDRTITHSRDHLGRIIRREYDAPEFAQPHPLTHAMSAVTEYIRGKSRRATAMGSVNANAIYSEVISSIAKVGPVVADQANLESLRMRLFELSDRSKAFAELKMIAPLKSDDLDKGLIEADVSKANLVSSVLTPYLDSIQAQLNALQPAQKLVSTLLKTANDFLIGKKLRFTIPAGLYLTSRGSTLDPTLLSSGEQHLLLMFCYVIIAQNRQTIFIIDEPEISLNIKWQSKILQSLLKLSGDAPMQFLLATHSIELISEYIEGVVRLPPYKHEDAF